MSVITQKPPAKTERHHRCLWKKTSVNNISIETTEEAVMQNNYLTLNEVSEMLHLSKSSVYCYVGSRKIPHIKLGGRLLFPENDLTRWLDSMKKPADNKTSGRNK
jgi:excisionase family DNA binding protein